MTIDEFWNKLIQHEGETFYTVRGLEFTYSISGTNFHISRVKNQAIHISNFEKAIELMPLTGSGQISNIVRGSAYVYALLTAPELQ